MFSRRHLRGSTASTGEPDLDILSAGGKSTDSFR